MQFRLLFYNFVKRIINQQHFSKILRNILIKKFHYLKLIFIKSNYQIITTIDNQSLVPIISHFVVLNSLFEDVFSAKIINVQLVIISCTFVVFLLATFLKFSVKVSRFCPKNRKEKKLDRIFFSNYKRSLASPFFLLESITALCLMVPKIK